MKKKYIVLVVILVIVLIAALVWWFRATKKKTLIAAILSKDASKTKSQLQGMSIKQLQNVLDALQGSAPVTHPGGNVNPPSSNNNTPPLSTPPIVSAPELKVGSKLTAKTITHAYQNYAMQNLLDDNDDAVSFDPGEYVGEVLSIGGLLKVRNYFTNNPDINVTEFYVPNKAYTITN